MNSHIGRMMRMMSASKSLMPALGDGGFPELAQDSNDEDEPDEGKDFDSEEDEDESGDDKYSDAENAQYIKSIFNGR